MIYITQAGIIRNGKIVRGKVYIKGTTCIFRPDEGGQMQVPFGIIDAVNRGGVTKMDLGNGDFLWMGCLYGLGHYCKDQLDQLLPDPPKDPVGEAIIASMNS